MRRTLLVFLLVLAACGSSVPRPAEEDLRAQMAVLLNRVANTDNQSWDNALAKRQLNSALPQGRATAQGWLLEWTPRDGALAYALIPWDSLGLADPGVKGQTPYDGGQPANQTERAAIAEAVHAGLDPLIRDVVLVNSIRISGDLAAFLVTPLLPVADDGYGFARKSGGAWVVEDLGSSDVGCGILTAGELQKFKMRCSS